MRIAGKSAASIFSSIRELAQTGALTPGDALPTVRDLARQLEVNRNTVAAAYQRLVSAGIAVTRGRQGTFIREPLQSGEQEGSAHPSPLVDAASGNPDPAQLPALLEYLDAGRYSTRLYGEAVINPELEPLIRDWFQPDCANPYEVDITHGAVDAMERLLTTWLVPGDRVIIEDPCFLGSMNTLRIKGFQMQPVALDEYGLQPEPLKEALASGARALICTPRAHNPTGCSLDARRAREIKKILRSYPHVLVIEDDHFALLSGRRYFSITPKGQHNWAILRSVSKCYGPDLRIAFVASDPETSRRLRMRLASGTTWVSHILQNIVTQLFTSSRAQQQLAAAKDTYQHRRDACIRLLQEKHIPVLQPADGLNIWLPLTTDAARITALMAQRGWLLRNGESFYAGEIRQALRVTVAALSFAQIEKFAEDLQACLASQED